MTKPKIHFRPHHFLCTLAFQGKGYSKPFIDNYQRIASQLADDPSTPIHVQIGQGDSVCEACPNLQSDKRCEREAKVRGIDDAYQAHLRLAHGDTLSWQEAKERIRSHITVTKFQQACQSCRWFSMGLCESALVNLLTESN